MRTRWHGAMLLAGCALAAAAPATQAAYYDDFSGALIDGSRWDEGESWRQIDSRGHLRIGLYSFGSTNGDSGISLFENVLHKHNPTPATKLRATLTVTDLQVDAGCAANASPGFYRARVFGTFFNTRAGGPVAGDRTGDVVAQVRVGRFTNSTDAAGVLRVVGSVATCTSSDCFFSSTVSTVQDLGTAAVGQAVVAQVIWDRAHKRFLLSRDGQAPGIVTYTDDDSTPPVRAINIVGVANSVPACTAARTRGGVAASIDNVIISP